MRRAPTLAIVKALRVAHDNGPDPVPCPTPKEARKGRRSTKLRRGGSRDRRDRNRGGGNSVGGGGQSWVRDTGKMVGVVATITAAGMATVVESAGGESGTGGGPQCRQGSNQARTNRSGGRSSGGGTGRRRNNARGPFTWNGSSTSSRSSSSSKTDHGEMKVVAGKRQVTP